MLTRGIVSLAIVCFNTVKFWRMAAQAQNWSWVKHFDMKLNDVNSNRELVEPNAERDEIETASQNFFKTLVWVVS